jgi:menaquinone-dependent protoporphyrinogen IX oxidase
MKILIVYGTRYGMTKKTAEELADILRGHYNFKVDITTYKISKSLKAEIVNYNLVIVGSSIVAGFWKSGAKKFLKKHRSEFKNVAIFVTAAGTLERAKEKGQPKEEGVSTAKLKYIEPIKNKYGIETLTDGVFGGQYGQEPKIKFNNWNLDDIKEWARELDYKLQNLK